MKSDSKLFSGIRIKPRGKSEPKDEGPKCEWEGCDQPGTHRAPKSQRHDGEFFTYCLAHVREYNKNFNYFSEMKEGDIEESLRRAAQTGERPTWGMGVNPGGKAQPRTRRPLDFNARRLADPHNFFARVARNQGRGTPMTEKERRLLEADRRALEVLGLEGYKTSIEIKTAYKALVKIHHPDANGGDRSTEDRLRAIIDAYNHLKQKGFVS